VLYVRGAVDILVQPGIAVVGTRHPTPYGSGMAERLAIDLAARGLIIQSGMARGVDTAAHRGAINGKGKRSLCSAPVSTSLTQGEHTLVGADRRSGRSADLRVSTWHVCRSAELSNPQPHHQRHVDGRAGVEAAEYSGTRITARCALEQNREVFAVPGNVTNKNPGVRTR